MIHTLNGDELSSVDFHRSIQLCSQDNQELVSTVVGKPLSPLPIKHSKPCRSTIKKVWIITSWMVSYVRILCANRWNFFRHIEQHTDPCNFEVDRFISLGMCYIIWLWWTPINPSNCSKMERQRLAALLLRSVLFVCKRHFYSIFFSPPFQSQSPPCLNASFRASVCAVHALICLSVNPRLEDLYEKIVMESVGKFDNRELEENWLGRWWSLAWRASMTAEIFHSVFHRWLNSGPVQNIYRQVKLKCRLPQGQARIFFVEPCWCILFTCS